MEINDSMKVSLIRKGNEFFNSKKLDEAYRCYITASYLSGIERIADYYNDEKNTIKAYRLYKYIQKNEKSIEGSVRIKKKVEAMALLFVKAMREWTKKDSSINKKLDREQIISKAKETLDQKNKFHSRGK